VVLCQLWPNLSQLRPEHHRLLLMKEQRQSSSGNLLLKRQLLNCDQLSFNGPLPALAEFSATP
jgi:hypothetical protein